MGNHNGIFFQIYEIVEFAEKRPFDIKWRKLNLILRRNQNKFTHTEIERTLGTKCHDLVKDTYLILGRFSDNEKIKVILEKFLPTHTWIWTWNDVTKFCQKQWGIRLTKLVHPNAYNEQTPWSIKEIMKNTPDLLCGRPYMKEEPQQRDSLSEEEIFEGIHTYFKALGEKEITVPSLMSFGTADHPTYGRNIYQYFYRIHGVAWRDEMNRYRTGKPKFTNTPEQMDFAEREQEHLEELNNRLIDIERKWMVGWIDILREVITEYTDVCSSPKYDNLLRSQDNIYNFSHEDIRNRIQKAEKRISLFSLLLAT